MTAQPTPQPGGFVYLCERYGQPLSGPHGLCASAQAAKDRYGAARAIRSSELSRLAAAARAALGGRR